MATMAGIGDEIRRKREAKGWGPGQLALAAGLSRSAVHEIETARVMPRVSTLWKLARALGSPLTLDPPDAKPAAGFPRRFATLVELEAYLSVRGWEPARGQREAMPLTLYPGPFGDPEDATPFDVEGALARQLTFHDPGDDVVAPADPDPSKGVRDDVDAR